MDQTLVQVRFSKKNSEGLEYQDALYFTPEQFDKETPESLEAAKQSRFDNWVSVVTAPPPEPVEQTKEELIKLAADLESQKASIQREYDEVFVKIQVKEVEEAAIKQVEESVVKK